jgi:excisionase family DNA binding protein
LERITRARAISRLLTVAEVADRLNLCRWTVRKLAADGRLPAVRLVPGKLLFREADVEEALRRASGPASAAQGLTGTLCEAGRRERPSVGCDALP